MIVPVSPILLSKRAVALQMRSETSVLSSSSNPKIMEEKLLNLTMFTFSGRVSRTTSRAVTDGKTRGDSIIVVKEHQSTIRSSRSLPRQLSDCVQVRAASATVKLYDADVTYSPSSSICATLCEEDKL